MKYSGLSDVGVQRDDNQDAWSIEKIGDDAVLAIVCDGMGGAAGGVIASTQAVESFTGEFLRLYHERLETGIPRAFDVKRIFIGAASKANSDVLSRAHSDHHLLGMGTTLTSAFVYDGVIYTANVGDSRVYLLRHGSLRQLTHDHSYVQMLVDNMAITREEAKVHPQRNMITRAVGTGHSAEADITYLEVEPGDILLLCSDGLTEYVSDADITRILLEKKDPARACRTLIDAANRGGGGDNITAVVVVCD